MSREHAHIEMSSAGKYFPASSNPLVTQHSTPLSLTQSMKTLGTKGVRSLGTFMGISDQKDESVLHWRETWIRRVKSGNVGISLQVGKLESPTSTPLNQLEETLSQLTQIGNMINVERTVSDNEDLSLLEDIHLKRKTVSLSRIPQDLHLSPSLQKLLDSCKSNVDKHKIHRTEDLCADEPGPSHITEHHENFNCETSEKFTVDAHVHRKPKESSKTLVLLHAKSQLLQANDDAEAKSNTIETEQHTFISATVIKGEDTSEHRKDEHNTHHITKVGKLTDQQKGEEISVLKQLEPVSLEEDIPQVQDPLSYSKEGQHSDSWLSPVRMSEVEDDLTEKCMEERDTVLPLAPVSMEEVQGDLHNYSDEEQLSDVRLSLVLMTEVDFPNCNKDERDPVRKLSPVLMSEVEDLPNHGNIDTCRCSASWLSPVLLEEVPDPEDLLGYRGEDWGSASPLGPVFTSEGTCIAQDVHEEVPNHSENISESWRNSIELNCEGEEEICLSQIKLSVEGTSSESSMVHEEHSFVYGKEAYDHYRLFRELENSKKLERLTEEKQKCVETLQWQLDTLDEIATVGKDYFNHPEGKAAKRWKELRSDVAQKGSDKLVLQNQLGSLPTFLPFFTYFIILAQTVTLTLLCSLGGITKIGFEPQVELRENVKTFLGTETVDRLIIPNPWIGPASLYFIGVGAVYAPCMREDYQLNLYIVKRNYSADDPLGCCEIVSRNTAGTTTEQECDTLTNGVGQWRSDTVCSERMSGENSIQHNMRPCCLGHTGACHLLSHSHCIFLGGQAHTTDKQHCSQVNCLKDVCGIGEVSSAPNRPWLPVSPDQWWRFPLSLLYTQGVIQLVIVSTGHFLLTRRIEVIAGWLRLAIIFIISGILGVMAAAIFSPYEAHVGSVGGLFCMVGVALVEFLQSWKLVEHPFQELAKFIFIIALFLFSGTLPHLNNAQLMTSFITGMVTAILILPYVTFGRWHQRCRRLLVGLAATLLLTMLFLLLFIFYNVQSVLPQCFGCQYIECIPYTDKLCRKYDFMTAP